MTPVRHLTIALTILFHGIALHAQSRPHGIWVGAGFGYGSLSRSTSELSDDRHDTFTGRFSGGYNVSSHLRLGIELGGWAIEMFNLNDPSKGEGVSNLVAVAEVYPWSGRAFFLKGGGVSPSTAIVIRHRPRTAALAPAWCWGPGLTSDSAAKPPSH
jgi:hypothetical protein